MLPVALLAATVAMVMTKQVGNGNGKKRAFLLLFKLLRLRQTQTLRAFLVLFSLLRLQQSFV
jgi:hypothetical protein